MQRKSLLLSLSLSLSLSISFAQIPLIKSMWASSELGHQFGDNQTTGQLLTYPQNVFSKPPTSASPDNPSYMATDICSMGGDKAYIALGFYPTILNGPGADFTVFENVLRVISGKDTTIFQEWMMVSASNDGITWYDFPYDSLSGEGMAGRNFTYGNTATYKDPKQSGGDAFDLSVVGLDSAKYIRVTDATHFQNSSGGSADLDAIAAIWQVGDDITGINEKNTVHAAIDVQGRSTFYCLNTACKTASVYDLSGKLIEKHLNAGNCGQFTFNTAGLYILSFEGANGAVHTQKITIQ